MIVLVMCIIYIISRKWFWDHPYWDPIIANKSAHGDGDGCGCGRCKWRHESLMCNFLSSHRRVQDQTPVPLSIFRSNSKFDENSKHSSVKYTRPITAIFCTRHDSVTVVTSAKYRCDRSSKFETRAFWIFIEFRIRSKYALWDERQLRKEVTSDLS